MRVDRLVTGCSLGKVVETAAVLFEVRYGVIEMIPVGLRGQFRQQRFDRQADVTDKAEIELAAAPEVPGANIDLGDLRMGRQELLVWEIR
ncbi:MAG: hypothetical protein ACRYGP_05315, partial [Janthinobacterium lividum]